MNNQFKSHCYKCDDTDVVITMKGYMCKKHLDEYRDSMKKEEAEYLERNRKQTPVLKIFEDEELVDITRKVKE